MLRSSESWLSDIRPSWQSAPPPSACAGKFTGRAVSIPGVYSPKCVEHPFSEVQIQNPA